MICLLRHGHYDMAFQIKLWAGNSWGRIVTLGPVYLTLCELFKGHDGHDGHDVAKRTWGLHLTRVCVRLDAVLMPSGVTLENRRGEWSSARGREGEERRNTVMKRE